MSKEMKETRRNWTKYELEVTKKQIEKENALLIDWFKQSIRKYRENSETQEMRLEVPIEIMCVLRRVWEITENRKTE